MFCRNCGKKIDDGVRFCRYCGEPVILANGNGPAADRTAGQTGHTGFSEPDQDRERTLTEGAGEYGDRSGYGGHFRNSGRSAEEGTAKFGDPTGSGEQFSGGGNAYSGGPAATGGQDYTAKVMHQDRPADEVPSGPSGQQGGQVREQEYRPPANLRGDKKGKNDNSFTILLGVVAAVLFVTLGFLIYKIFLSQPVTGGKKDPSSFVTVTPADSSKPAKNPSGSGTSDTGTGSSTGTGSGSSQNEPAVTPEEVKGFEAVDQKAKSAAYPGAMEVVSVDVTDYPNVKLYCSLTDSAGEGIVMQSPTAGVRESISGGEEIEREIVSIERLEGNQGIGFDILVDKSSSISDELSQMQSILTDFITNLDYASGDAAEIISFDTYVMYMCMYTDNMSNLLNGISNMSAYGRTALYDALIEGISNAGNRTGANCVIAFTDGEDNESRYSYEEVVTFALERDVPVYIIGFGNNDYGRLESLSEQTGGCYWNINDITDMSEILRTIYEQEKDLYCIEYASEGSADPYTARSVSCAIADDNSGGAVYNYGYTAAQRKEKVSHASRYELVIGDYSWSEANRDALVKGGHLVTITSQEEMNQIAAMAENAGLKYIWMGGYTSVRNGTAYGHWTTGEMFAFAPWYPGEPSRNDLDGAPEFYLIFWNVDGVWSFNDERDDVAADLPSYRGKMGYVIEYEQ